MKTWFSIILVLPLLFHSISIAVLPRVARRVIQAARDQGTLRKICKSTPIQSDIPKVPAAIAHLRQKNSNACIVAVMINYQYFEVDSDAQAERIVQNAAFSGAEKVAWYELVKE